MTVFNKRNALIGYVTLQALKRQRRASKLRRRAPRIALFSAVGLLSLGAVIGIFAVLHRRRGEDDIAGLGEDAARSEVDLDDLTAE